MATTKRTRWLGLAVLILPTLLVSMDSSSLYLAIPRLSEQLQPSASQLLWIIDIYAFLLAGLLITMGNIGDRIGRRKLLMIGAGLFGAASLAAAFSPSANMLIATRALMGVGGATLMPSTLSLIRSLFDDAAERGRAIGIWAAGFSGGAVLGPIIGGVLLEFFDWGAIFLINVPVVVLLILVAPILLPEYRQAQPESLDFTSVLLALGGLLPLMYALKHIAETRAASGTTISLAISGAVLLVVFVRRQFVIPGPLIDPVLLRDGRFRVAFISGSMALFAIVVSSFFAAQFFQMVLGYSPLIAALLGVPSAIVVGTGSVIAPALARRFGLGPTVRLAFTSGAIGLVVYSLTGVSNPWLVVLGSSLTGAGLSVVLTLGTDLVVTAAPPDRAGAASALSETGIELGAAMGIAVLGSLGSFVYSKRVQDANLAPLIGEHSSTVETTLANALHILPELPPHTHETVLGVAQPAFVSGMAAATLVGAAITLSLAWLVPRWLRRAMAN